jgi:hypothetical protein
VSVLTIRLFLAGEGAAFLVAALVHAGVLPLGYEHAGAAVPEGIIGAVLLAGLALTWLLPARLRAIATAAQGFALMGSLVGLYVGVIGVGPHTVPDLVFHAGIVLTLLWGLVVATRETDGAPETKAGSGRGARTRLAAVGVAQTLIRATGLLQLALGLAFWTGRLLVAVPFHIFNGLLFVVLLLVQAGLAAWAGAPWRLVLVAIAWALLVPVFGLAQATILPGELHWIVQGAHLLIGLVAMEVAERLAAAARRRHGRVSPADRSPQRALGGRPRDDGVEVTS